MVSVGAAMAGCDLTPPKDALTLTPSPSAMARLQRLHAAAGQLAEDAPEIIAKPEAARGLEQLLIEAMVACPILSIAGDADRLRKINDTALAVAAIGLTSACPLAGAISEWFISDAALLPAGIEVSGLGPHEYASSSPA
jgi:hypothetical protein